RARGGGNWAWGRRGAWARGGVRGLRPLGAGFRGDRAGDGSGVGAPLARAERESGGGGGLPLPPRRRAAAKRRDLGRPWGAGPSLAGSGGGAPLPPRSRLGPRGLPAPRASGGRGLLPHALAPAGPPRLDSLVDPLPERAGFSLAALSGRDALARSRPGSRRGAPGGGVLPRLRPDEA